MTHTQHWDSYRAAYPDMGYDDVSAFHDWVWKNYPNQHHHSPEMMDLFFAGLFTRTLVLEIGGWTGEAAARQLAAYPDIKAWINFEICRGAVLRPVTTDPRYRPVWPEHWVWNTIAPTVDVAVLSHVIEHVSDKQLPHLLRWIADSRARHLYIESPITEDGQSWMGDNSAHVLTLGWGRVIDLLESFGYHVMHRETAPSGHSVLFVAQ